MHKKISIAIKLISLILIIGIVTICIYNKNNKQEEVIIEDFNNQENMTNKEEGIVVEYKIEQSWKEQNKLAHKYLVKLINNSEENVENWKILFNVNETTKISQVWNGRIESENSKIIINPESYNNIVEKSKEIEIGLILLDDKEKSINGYELYINNKKYNIKIEEEKDQIKQEKMNESISKIVNNSSNSPVQEHGNLKVQGTKIVDKNGNDFVIQGVSTHGIAWFPQYINYETFKTLRDDFNVNTIRLALYSDKNAGYTTNLHSKVEEGVEYARQLGMYVIIDWHILNDNNPNQNKENAISFFTEMANKYKDDENVLYEICNEPNGNVTWQNDIKPYAEELIKTIRSVDKDAIIIVGTPTWCQDVDIVSKNPIENYTNIVYALHFYAATHKDDIRNKLRTALNNNLPILVSEFGITDASGNGEINKDEANKWINLLRENKIGYVCWNLSNKNESSSILNSSSKNVSNWTDEELSEEGKWLKQIYNN